MYLTLTVTQHVPKTVPTKSVPMLPVVPLSDTGEGVFVSEPLSSPLRRDESRDRILFATTPTQARASSASRTRSPDPEVVSETNIDLLSSSFFFCVSSFSLLCWTRSVLDDRMSPTLSFEDDVPLIENQEDDWNLVVFDSEKKRSVSSKASGVISLFFQLFSSV